MASTSNAGAIRVQGEVIVLHCWACGTAHCVNLKLCAPGELSRMVCSNSSCGMSMFLVNELALDDKSRKELAERELEARAIHPRPWQ
jgi:hypothetical protein